jgi:hypothetical protein
LREVWMMSTTRRTIAQAVAGLLVASAS